MLTVAFLAALYLNTASGMLYFWVNNCVFHSFHCASVQKFLQIALVLVQNTLILKQLQHLNEVVWLSIYTFASPSWHSTKGGEKCAVLKSKFYQ